MLRLPHRASAAQHQNPGVAQSPPETRASEHSTSPAWLFVVPENIPRELVDARAWYPALIRPKVGKVGQWDKIPGDPTTGQPSKWSEPSTRCTFSDAYMAYQRDERFGGIGYMMDADAGVIGIDLDHSVDVDGNVAPWAQVIVDGFPGAYWERSISGTGLRGFCRGSLPVGGCRSKIEGCSVELYADVRFLVVTGQAVQLAEVLPELQAAVDTLHAKLNAGRVRATGTAIGTGLTGRIDGVSPEVLGILEAVMGDRYGARMAEIWGRDDLHVAGASEDDWALESEIAYQAIRRGYVGSELARVVEETMRAGPYRAKWDDPRGSVTWLAQDVANAIATVQKRVADRPAESLRHQLDAVDAEPLPADETAEQTIARLERELAQARALVAAQQTIVRAERAERQEIAAQLADCRARALETAQVFRNPALRPPEKLVAIALAWLVESGQSRGEQEIRVYYPDVAKATGLSEATIQRCVSNLTDPDDAPLAKRTVTEWRDVTDPETGQLTRRPTSATFLRARGAGSIRSAVAIYRPENRPKHGGKRIPHCPEHPTADLIIRSTTHCAECDETLAGPTESLRHQLEAVGGEVPPVDSTSTYGPQVETVGGHDGEELAERAAAMAAIPDPIRIHEARAGRRRRRTAAVLEPLEWLDEWPDHDQERPPPRCVGPGCLAPCDPGDDLLCVAHRAEVDAPTAVAGGSE
jgi:hypothetical protein